MQIGVIDIGSNSIRTMEAACMHGAFHFSPKQVHTTRLAEGLSATGKLKADAMTRTLAVIAEYAEQMRQRGVPVYAYATSAVRDAKNRDAFAFDVRALIGFDRLEILTGEQEARIAHFAATAGHGGMLDIGGGSFQLVTDQNAVSFPMGCVRARDLCPGDTLLQITAALYPLLDAFSIPGDFCAARYTGVGGTVTTLAAYCANCASYDPQCLQNAVLTPALLKQTLQKLEAMGSDRQAHPLLTKRHDVILHGGAILQYLMQKLAIKTLFVSDADGLEGYAVRILERLARQDCTLPDKQNPS